MVAAGQAVTGAAAQPRRLAVLALLARAGRAGVTREKILALLWPDEPEDKARRSLNQAVYSLRRDLGGEDALLGTKDLRINLDLLRRNLTEADARVWSRAEVLRMLYKVGFTPVDDGWIGSPQALAQLEPEEVISVEDAEPLPTPARPPL